LSVPQYDPSLGHAWIQWTELEASLGDVDRARGIYELAVQQALDMPELVWKVGCAKAAVRSKPFTRIDGPIAGLYRL
jgi:hypothetical protein